MTYELVFPFVCTTSAGGPYDDAAFVAGMPLGQLDAHLRTLKSVPVPSHTVTVYRELVAQADLIAMARGWSMAEQEIPDEDGVDNMGEVRAEWAILRFELLPEDAR